METRGKWREQPPKDPSISFFFPFPPAVEALRAFKPTKPEQEQELHREVEVVLMPIAAYLAEDKIWAVPLLRRPR